jgi:putative iron-dependent peroxidase
LTVEAAAPTAADMSTRPCQPTILAPPPRHGRYLVFGLKTGSVQDGGYPRPALLRLRDATAGWTAVLGLGAPLVHALSASVEGLRPFPALAGAGVAFPSTQGAVWAWLAGGDRGELVERALAVTATLGEGFTLDEEVDAFLYDGGRDLTGFEDGTENPKGDAAVEAALVSGRGPGLDGSSFVAVQKYRHDLDRFHALAGPAQDAVIGRARVSNEELPDAPPSAHVKRTAQESFDPPAFMLRRSLLWGGAGEHGLYFVAFGESLERFERVLGRMAGRADGVVDALLRFTRALSGGYYWCPPLRDGRLDLSALGM